MKLTDIDLNDKSEVSAAHALLAAILGHAVSDDIPGAPSLNQSTAGMIKPLDNPEAGERPASEVFRQPIESHIPAGVDIGGPHQDPAVVFGGQPAQSATPLPGTLAPSIAGADPSQTALAGLPGISAALPGVTSAPAHHIAPGALVPGGAAAALGQPAGPSSPASNVELDSRGLPWDGRIHASTKSKKKDGAWTALRGLNDGAKVAQIEAELRASVQSAAPLPAAGALPVNPGPASAAQALPGLPASGAALPGIAIAGSSVPPAGAALPVSADPTTFEQIMPRVTAATIAQILPPTAMQAACAALGLPSVVALQTNPAYVPHVWAQLKASYPALQ